MFMRAIALLLALTGPAIAEVPDNLVRVGVIEGWRDGKVHVSGLTIRMAPGWHTYWRSPGDAGIPPSFNWSGSSNLGNVRVHFPVPEVIETEGLRSIGYTDQVTFPLVIEPRDATKPVSLKGEIEIGVCEDICVPVTFAVSATLPVGGSHSRTLAVALKDAPERGGRMSCEISPIADGLRVTAMANVPRIAGSEFVVIETGNAAVWVSPAVLQRKGKRLRADVEMVAPSAKPFALARSEVRMTVLGDGRAVEMIGCN